MLHSGELPPRVDVLDSGYKWNGEVYPTLTHISWKATGYQIGGNNFFGLPVKRRGESNKNPLSVGTASAFFSLLHKHFLSLELRLNGFFSIRLDA